MPLLSITMRSYRAREAVAHSQRVVGISDCGVLDPMHLAPQRSKRSAFAHLVIAHAFHTLGMLDGPKRAARIKGTSCALTAPLGNAQHVEQAVIVVVMVAWLPAEDLEER